MDKQLIFLIIFSDILIIPYGLNQKVEFKKGYGPILGEIDFDKIDKSYKKPSEKGKKIQRTKKKKKRIKLV